MTRLAKVRLVAAVAFSICAGVASASVLVPQQGSESLGGPDRLQPGDEAPTVGAARPDPQGGPDWAVRVYRSKTGESCPEAGRTSAGRFGRVDGPGRFEPLPVEASGSCGDLRSNLAAFAVDRYPETSATGARTAIFGVVAARVRSVTLTSPSGTQPVELDRGSFLIVREGLELNGLAVAFTTADGSTTTYPLSSDAK